MGSGGIEFCGRLLAISICVLLITDGAYPQDVTFQVAEEKPPGEPVGDVAMAAGLYDVYNATVRSTLYFSFLNNPNQGVGKDYFTLDRRTGFLSVAKEIDREAVCPLVDRCQLFLTVAVGPPAYFQSISVQVTILDINDHSPTFSRPGYQLTIPEDSQVNARFDLPSALDVDSGPNGRVSYSLTPVEAAFTLAQVSPGGVGEVELAVLAPLDREARDHYELYLVAVDSGAPMRSSSALINITIADVNDHRPGFLQQAYHVTVNESAAPPHFLIKVQATDPDLGEAGRITYSFQEQTANAYSDTFEIHPQSGEIMLKKSLDYEVRKSFNLTVVARDNDDTPLSAFTTVVLDVLDVNDWKPLIEINTLTDSGLPEIAEKSPHGTFVAHVVVVDQDSGLNGAVDCYLNSVLFRLQAIEGSSSQKKIVSATDLDYEIRAVYPVTITCVDNGDPPQQTSRDLTIRVLDVNDHRPTFDQSNYGAVIFENNDPEVIIVQAQAEDLDSGENARLWYSLVEPMANVFFRIDHQSGAIRSRTFLDYENRTSYVFHVTVRDSGKNQLTSTATINITLRDENDNVPKFTQPQFSFAVKENQPPGLQVGRVYTDDPDSDEFSRVLYDFYQESAALKELFVLNPNTGRLHTNRVYDREMHESFTFDLIAYNPDKPSESGKTTVNVFVEDLNDNRPIITYPNYGNNTVYIPSFAMIGDTFAVVKAQDADDGNNAKLSFEITSGNDARHFAISVNTGAIMLAKEIPGYSLYNLSIKVSDRGLPPESATSYLVVIANQSVTVAPNLSGDDPEDEGGSASNNYIIIICLVSATAVIIILLVAAIMWLICKSRKRKRETTIKYQPRPDSYTDDLDIEARKKPLGTPGNGQLTNQRATPNGKENEKEKHNSTDSGIDESADIKPNPRAGYYLSAGPLSKVKEQPQDVESKSDSSNADSGFGTGEADHVDGHYPRVGSSRNYPDQYYVFVHPTTHQLALSPTSPNAATFPSPKSACPPSPLSENGGMKPPSNVPLLHARPSLPPRAPLKTFGSRPQVKFQSPVFNDSDSLLRYKSKNVNSGATNGSEVTDNSSTTSGSYVIGADRGSINV